LTARYPVFNIKPLDAACVGRVFDRQPVLANDVPSNEQRATAGLPTTLRRGLRPFYCGDTPAPLERPSEFKYLLSTSYGP
jgi:hypothetical protein